MLEMVIERKELIRALINHGFFNRKQFFLWSLGALIVQKKSSLTKDMKEVSVA